MKQTERIALRITTEERLELEKKARTLGLTLSEYIRSIIFGKKIRVKVV